MAHPECTTPEHTALVASLPDSPSGGFAVSGFYAWLEERRAKKRDPSLPPAILARHRTMWQYLFDEPDGVNLKWPLKEGFCSQTKLCDYIRNAKPRLGIGSSHLENLRDLVDYINFLATS